MNDHRPTPEDATPQAPQPLARALAELERRSPVVPPQVDEAILREARLHLQALKVKHAQPASISRPAVQSLIARLRERLFARSPWAMPWAAATAALVLAGLLVHSFWSGRTVKLAEDLNHDGTFDILDAFALAREVDHGSRLSPQLDLNGDGVVDRQDANALAARAVTLNQGGRL